MGYSRYTAKAFGVVVSVSDIPDADEKEFEETLEEILEKYPLLTYEIAGDLREDEIEYLVVVEDTVDYNADEEFTRQTDDGNALLPVALTSGTEVDSNSTLQLSEFALTYQTSAEPSWYRWSTIE